MNDKNINIWINGATGKMGSELRSFLQDSKNILITGVISPNEASQILEVQNTKLEIANDFDSLASKTKLPDAIVDFTYAKVAYDSALYCAQNNINFVSGTTGINDDQKDEIIAAFSKSNANAIIASNFSLGAVLMMEFSAKAAPFFSEIEIVETHHTRKLDAPSGTAITTAIMINESLNKADKDAREIPTHSLRLSGAVAHQQVHLSSAGEILRIEHDANDRKCFMPGVVLSIENVSKLEGVIFSIAPLLFD